MSLRESRASAGGASQTPTGAGEVKAVGGVSWVGKAANPQAQCFSKGPRRWWLWDYGPRSPRSSKLHREAGNPAYFVKVPYLEMLLKKRPPAPPKKKTHEPNEMLGCHFVTCSSEPALLASSWCSVKSCWWGCQMKYRMPREI